MLKSQNKDPSRAYQVKGYGNPWLEKKRFGCEDILLAHKHNKLNIQRLTELF